MIRDYQGWQSHNLERRMEFLWFGHAGVPLLMFPTSLGRFYQYEDMGLVASLTDPINQGEVQLICVDSVDAESWYNNHAAPGDRAWRHELYDRYIHQEVIPYIQQRTSRSGLSVFGASFGAYHAANIASRYPDEVRSAILLSGVFSIRRFLNGFFNETCYFHDPMSYIANMDSSWVTRLARIRWVIATGEQDHLAEENRAFASLLTSKGIPNHTEIWPGVFGHDWPFWKEHLPRLLQL